MFSNPRRTCRRVTVVVSSVRVSVHPSVPTLAALVYVCMSNQQYFLGMLISNGTKSACT